MADPCPDPFLVPHRRGLRHAAGAAVVAVLAGLGLVVASPVATAVQSGQNAIVSDVPAALTPAVNSGAVHAMAQVGPTVVIGGTFASISPPGGTKKIADGYAAAFTAATGRPVTGFAPVLNGEVESVSPGPTDGTVYVGGGFTSVDGVTARIALLNAATGDIVPGWTAPAIDGPVHQLLESGGHLFVGGAFDNVGGEHMDGLVALDPGSGAVQTSYPVPSFTGHHNYRGQPGQPEGGVGPYSFDINPAGTQLVVVGNFTSVDGVPRDQVARLTLGSSGAAVDRSWATGAYTAACFSQSFDSYVRDVQFSGDGSYFVIASTGGVGTNSDGTRGSCDSVTRFDTGMTGSDVRPVWQDFGGGDSFYSLALTGGVVYTGGHQRWMNNTYGDDAAKPGATPRPGVAALDPANGLPFAWNPGRNPRGGGAFALLATSSGLYVGSDTDYIGDSTYFEPRLAFFPLTDGQPLPADATGALPGTVCLLGGSAGGDSAECRQVAADGTAAPPTLVPGIEGSRVRGAFEVDGNVFYGLPDGSLHERSFDGRSFGGPVTLDPYDDLRWSNVQTGSGQTYRGVAPTFAAEIPSLTSMVYLDGRIFYTNAGDPHMHWRWFTPDSGVVGAEEFTAGDQLDWSHVAGGFLSGSTLYVADGSRHVLLSVPFGDSGATGDAGVVAGTTDWASHGAFVATAAQSQRPTAPAVTGAAAADGRATVDVSPPADDGGHPLRSMTVTAVDETHPTHGGQSVNTLTSPVTVPGLLDGDTYHFLATAVNQVGPGPASAASESVRPPAKADVTVTTSGPQTERDRGRFTVGVRVGNRGPTAAAPVTVTLTLPHGVRLLHAAGASRHRVSISWRLRHLSNGQAAHLHARFIVGATQHRHVTFVAAVSSPIADPARANDRTHRHVRLG